MQERRIQLILCSNALRPPEPRCDCLRLSFGTQDHLADIDLFRLVKDVCNCSGHRIRLHRQQRFGLLHLRFELRVLYMLTKGRVGKAGSQNADTDAPCEFLPQSIQDGEYSGFRAGVNCLIRNSLAGCC